MSKSEKGSKWSDRLYYTVMFLIPIFVNVVAKDILDLVTDKTELFAPISLAMSAISILVMIVISLKRDEKRWTLVPAMAGYMSLILLSVIVEKLTPLAMESSLELIGVILLFIAACAVIIEETFLISAL